MSNLKNFQLDGYINTEKEVELIYNTIADDYLEASKIIKSQMREYYAKYLVGVKPEDYYNVMIQYNRLNNMLDDVEKSYIKYSRLAGGKVGKAAELGITNNFYRQRYALTYIDQPIDLKFGIINPYIVEASVYGTEEAWRKIQSDTIKRIYGNPNTYMRQGTLTELLVTTEKQSIAKLRRTLTSSLISGESYTVSAKKVSQLVGTFNYVDGTKHATGAMADALRIVRTEGNRNMNLGSLASTNKARSEGLDIVRRWNATLDSRTRSAHVQADNKPENEDGLFSVGGEMMSAPGSGGSARNVVNCRCTTIDVVDGQEPLLRRGRNPLTGENETFTYQDYDSYMTSKGMKKDKTGKYIASE